MFSRLRTAIQRAERWYLNTPDRALDDAYDAALAIRAIEEEHFQGQKIGITPGAAGRLTPNALAYFEADLKRYLKMVRMRMTEFRISRNTVDTTNPTNSANSPLNTLNGLKSLDSTDYTADYLNARLPQPRDRAAITLEKLKFIDAVLHRYQEPSNLSLAMTTTGGGPLTEGSPTLVTGNGAIGSPGAPPQSARFLAEQIQANSQQRPLKRDMEALSDQKGLLPRSILSTLGRLKRDLDPQSEVDMVQNFRVTKAKTFVSIRFLLVLISLTLFTQIFTRNILLSNQFVPGRMIMDHFRVEQTSNIFLNREMTEEALKELKTFEERMKFDNLLRSATDRPLFSPEEIEEKVREEAHDLAKAFALHSGDAIKNWVADSAGLIIFVLILLNSQREIEILKSFIDELVYGISDSAKAFIIILFTDIFVGFHSPHGWEVLLESVAKHFGLPPSHTFISLFIATFPVILDTIFKYWIFRFLNRVSPSAVATYKEMNE
jgi:CemA family